MASRTESMSGQINEDLNQQFAQYVRKQAPHDADTLLTDTASPEVADKRRELAWSFVKEQVQPAVDSLYSSGRSEIGSSMEGGASGGNKEAVIADHQSHREIIDQRTLSSNISNDVKNQVENMMEGHRSEIESKSGNIRGGEKGLDQQYAELQTHHKAEELSQSRKFNEEQTIQERLPGADTPEELLKKAKEYQNKNS